MSRQGRSANVRSGHAAAGRYLIMARRWFVTGLIGLLVAAAAIALVGEVLTLPVRRAIGAAPADLNAHTVTFATSIGSKVAGWMVVSRNSIFGKRMQST